MTVLHYVSLLVGTIAGILFVAGVTCYAIRRQPLFVIIQSWVVDFDLKFLALNLCVLILALLAYRWAHHMHK